MLHGYTGTPEGEEMVSGWTTFLSGTDTLVSYPQGNPTPAGGFGWTTGAARLATTATNDLADIDNVITTLIERDCVDPNQIMIAGESNGSGLGLLLGCDSQVARRVRLFALAIPAVDSNVTAQCQGARPFRLLVVASLNDQVVNYTGIYPAGQPPFTAPLSWFEQIATTVDGCRDLQSAAVPDGTHYWYTSCEEPADFYVANDGQHTWPGGPEGAGGLAPGVLPATKLAWCASRLTANSQPTDCQTVLGTYAPS
jgi:polyhydroxybutyrate depolymerase